MKICVMENVMKRFLQLERCFIRDPTLARDYAVVITGYIKQGFLRKADIVELEDVTTFLIIR